MDKPIQKEGVEKLFAPRGLGADARGGNGENLGHGQTRGQAEEEGGTMF